MINVRLWHSGRGNIVGYSITGHAGYAPRGTDIVCAAVSALTQAALLGLTEHLGLDPKVETETGYLSVMLPEGSEKDGTVQAILATLELALADIADQYPAQVCLKKEGL